MSTILELMNKLDTMRKLSEKLTRQLYQVKEAAGICQEENCLADVCEPNAELCEQHHKENEELLLQTKRSIDDSSQL